MELIGYEACVEDNISLGNEDLRPIELENLQYQTEFIGEERIAEEHLSFYGLTNILRSYSDAENEAFDNQDIERYKNQNEEVRSYVKFPDVSK